MNRPRTVAFADVGRRTGMGHLHRLLALTKAMADIANIQVFVPEEVRHSELTIPQEVLYVSPDFREIEEWRPAILIADSYRFHDHIARLVNCLNCTFAIFDDHHQIFTRPDILINAAPQAQQKYSKKDAEYLLLGPQYACLDPAFVGAKVRRTISAPKSILLALGGTDIANQSQAIANILHSYNPSLKIYVVGAAKVSGTDKNAHNLGWQTSSELALTLQTIDIGIISGGTLTYQMAATGTPAIVIPQTEAQNKHARQWEELGTLMVCQHNESLVETMEKMTLKTLTRMHRTGPQVVDGKGPKRIAAVIESLI